MGRKRQRDQKASGHEQDTFRGQESFGWTRVNHRHPLPSPAQPPAVPGAPAAALPHTESSADSLRPLSCPKPAKLFKRLNTRQRDGAISACLGWAGISWQGAGGSTVGSGGSRRGTTGSGDPSAHCRGAVESGRCISPARPFPLHPFPSPSPQPGPISPTQSQGGAWAPHKFGRDPGTLFPCPGQHSPQGAGQPFPPANPCQKLT